MGSSSGGDAAVPSSYTAPTAPRPLVASAPLLSSYSTPSSSLPYAGGIPTGSSTSRRDSGASVTPSGDATTAAQLSGAAEFTGVEGGDHTSSSSYATVAEEATALATTLSSPSPQPPVSPRVSSSAVCGEVGDDSARGRSGSYEAQLLSPPPLIDTPLAPLSPSGAISSSISGGGGGVSSSDSVSSQSIGVAAGAAGGGGGGPAAGLPRHPGPSAAGDAGPTLGVQVAGQPLQ